ncbi:hypothetical protein HU200_048982 [Digitaria exilis]|uniref:DUF4220 domain-containing protein n=1 Tax=Digitaria exilis TaxID=1010633 RepID=A0A835ECQ5_9POAL|nr:hypothetical protein HU200_048982 [Digitaria exilis]
MDQLAACVEATDQHMLAPALVVKGEDTVIVKNHPHGYQFERTELVTLKDVWELHGMPVEQKDLCFSFSLFKLLRCQFARYRVFNPRLREVVQMFFREKYFKEDNNYERLFQVVADELSFIQDYYNSFLPISYSHQLFPVMNIILSLLSMCYCSYLFVFVSGATKGAQQLYGLIYCILFCGKGSNGGRAASTVHVSPVYFDLVPAYSVITVLMLSEIRDIAVYFCSNWTKVAFISNYTKYPPSWQKSLLVKKCIGFVFKCCKCRLTKKWAATLNQCSLPVGRQNKKDQCSIFGPIVQLLRLPNRKKIDLTNEVKFSIFKALEEHFSKKQALEEQLSKPRVLKHIGRPSIHGFNDWINDADAKHIADIVLAWHIAPNIFEDQTSGALISPARTSATQLSRYCAYLVDCHPELLPGENDEWCKSPFEAVKKYAEQECESLFNSVMEFVDRIIPGQSESKLLQKEYSKKIMEKGEKIAEKLATKTNGWEILEDFWSNMILYLATSENLDGHAKAIARGGELITLLWALLVHLGIVGSRLDGADDATSADHPC